MKKSYFLKVGLKLNGHWVVTWKRIFIKSIYNDEDDDWDDDFHDSNDDHRSDSCINKSMMINIE